MADYYQLKKEIDGLEEKKAKYEKRINSLLASREYVVKKLKDDYDLEVGDVEEKLEELNRSINMKTKKMEETVEKMKKYIEKLEWILEV